MLNGVRRRYYALINTINRLKVSITGERRNYVYSNLFPVLRNRRKDIFEQVNTRVKSKNIAYVLGVFLVFFAFLVKTYLDPIVQVSETPFLLSFVAVVVSSMSGGANPGIFTTLLAAFCSAFLLFEKNGSNFWSDLYLNQIRLFTFIFEGIFVSVLVGKLRDSQERAIVKSKLLINSEKHLRNVLNSLYAFVGVMTVNGTLIECNNAALDIANLTPEDVLGKPYEKTYWWDFSATSRKKLRKAINKAAKGELIRYDARLRIAKNRFITMDFTIVPIKDDLGRIVYLIPSGVDVSQRVETIVENKKLYQELDNEKTRLEQIIANTPGVVWETKGKPYGETEKITYVSDYAETLLEYPKAEWNSIPNFWTEVIHPEDRQRALEEGEEIFNTGKGGSSRYRWITKSGKILWVETRYVIITDSKKRPMGTRGVTVDISDRIKLEQRKDEFISIASHELKTPLTTVKAFTQILEKRLTKTGDTESTLYLNKMNTYINRLTKIIYDFLDFSKIQAGKLDLYEEDFRLDELVAEVVADMQPTSETHKIDYTNDVGNIEVRGDKNRISQVLINLISNAIKYSPEANKIAVCIDNKNAKAIVSVQDFGIGIPKSGQKKIFDRFYRVNQPKKIKIEGFGMGLYISAEIIRRHSGEIWFDSEEGKGSIFHFSLPYKAR